MSRIKIAKKGQSIIEVIIAMGILGMVLGGIVILLVNISSYGASSEARSLAVNYSQEAMDAVKNIRDNEYCSFFEKLNGCYRLDKTANIWSMTRIGDCGAHNAGDFVDIFPSGSREQSATNMQRQIRLSGITNIDGSNGRKVTVTIRWQIKGAPQETYTATTELYKWKY